MPAFAADFFGPKNAGTIYGVMLTADVAIDPAHNGPKNAGTIYGVMLTAWSAGAIVGPILITSFGTTKQPDYATPLYIIAVIMLVSCALPFIARILEQRQLADESVQVTAGSGR